jgi:hypothetical protein
MNNKRKKKNKTPPPPTCVDEDVGKKEPSHTAGWNVSWSNHSGKIFEGFLKI